MRLISFYNVCEVEKSLSACSSCQRVRAGAAQTSLWSCQFGSALPWSAWGRLHDQVSSQEFQMWGLWPCSGCNRTSFGAVVSPDYKLLLPPGLLPSEGLRRTWGSRLLSLQGKILLLKVLCRCNSVGSVTSSCHAHAAACFQCKVMVRKWHWGQRSNAIHICLAWWIFRLSRVACSSQTPVVALQVRWRCVIPLSDHSGDDARRSWGSVSSASMETGYLQQIQVLWDLQHPIKYLLGLYDQLQPLQTPHFSSRWAPGCPCMTTCWCGVIKGSHLLCFIVLQTGLVREALLYRMQWKCCQTVWCWCMYQFKQQGQDWWWFNNQQPG